MQVSCSPIASWISTAATEESTPPESAQITLPSADLLADRLDRMSAIGAHRPVAFDARDVVDEIRQELRAVRRVHHLGMELKRVEATLLVGDCREGCASRSADHLEALGYGRHLVAVAHPDLMARALRPNPFEKRVLLPDLEERAAEFAMMSSFHLAAELGAHGLLAVADAKHGNARLEDRIGRAWAADIDSRVGAAGKDHGFRLDAPKAFLGGLERDNLGKHAGFADAAGNQLRDLAAEIDDENGVGMSLAFHGGRLKKETSRRNGLQQAALILNQLLPANALEPADAPMGIGAAALFLCLSIGFSPKPVPTFGSDALAAATISR